MNSRVSLPVTLVALPLILGAFFLLSVSLWSPLAHAQEGDLPCMPPTYAPSRVFDLVPRIPQLAPSDVAVGIFVTHTFSIDLEGGEIVCLASSPDGRSALRVDDQIDLQVVHADGSKASWTYNFRDSVTGRIADSPSQDVSRLFSHDHNEVLIFLTDITPKYHSAEPIWLIVWRGPSPQVTNTQIATSTSVPTFTPTPTGSFVSTAVGVLAGTPTAPPSKPTLSPITLWFDALLPFMPICLAWMFLAILVFVLAAQFIRRHDLESLRTSVKKHDLASTRSILDRLHYLLSGKQFEKVYIDAVREQCISDPSEERRQKVHDYLAECYALGNGHYPNAAEKTIKQIVEEYIQKGDSNYLVFTTRARRRIRLKRPEHLAQEQEKDAELIAGMGPEKSKNDKQ